MGQRAERITLALLGALGTLIFDAAWTKGYRSKVLQLFVVLADGEKLPVTGCTRSDTAKMHTLLSALGNERVRISPRLTQSVSHSSAPRRCETNAGSLNDSCVCPRAVYRHRPPP
jgi:hypothetical protein